MDQNLLTPPLDASFTLVGSFDDLFAEKISPDLFPDVHFGLDVDIGPFPSGRTPPITTVLGLGSQLSMFPQGLPRVAGFSAEDELAKAIITVPTGPRLSTMLKEKLCVRKWAVSYITLPFQRKLSHFSLFQATITASDAPGHTPWCGPEDVAPVVWVAEGSMFPPEEFRQMLSHRQPFWNGVQDKLEPPTLMVSNSTFMHPIPLESSQNGVPEMPLAVRRGKKVPATLTLKSEMENCLYPGIPSAFLSPSAYSPNPDIARHPDEPSNLEDMVASLRSRCAPIRGYSTPKTCPFEGSIAEENLSYESMEMEDPEEDEWGFANSLTECYGELGFLSLTKESITYPLSMTLQHDYSSSLSPTLSVGNSAYAGSEARINERDDPLEAAERSAGMSQIDPIREPTTPPPSSPLPPRPALVSAFSPKRDRGILKDRKNVRFASLPNRREMSSTNLLLHFPKPRNSTGTSAASLHRPSPLRNHLRTPNHTTRPKATPTSPLIPRPSITWASAKKTKVAGVNASQYISSPMPLADRRSPINSSPLWNARGNPLSPKENKKAPCTLSPEKAGQQATSPSLRHSLNTTTASVEVSPPPAVSPQELAATQSFTSPKKSDVMSSLGLRSLGGLGESTLEKENRPRASSSPAGSSRWSALKDASFRTGSLKEPRSQKSRMPVPLRNILTKFK
jgi:hypothetical protein